MPKVLWGLRLALAALFGLSGLMKLRDPGLFAHAVDAFNLGLPEDAIVPLALFLPWLELSAAAGVLIPRLSRGAASIIVGLMVVFCAGIISLLARGLDVNCPCFGALKIGCSGPLGTCHLVRNALFALAAVAVIFIQRRPALAALSESHETSIP